MERLTIETPAGDLLLAWQPVDAQHPMTAGYVEAKLDGEEITPERARDILRGMVDARG